MKLLFDQNLSYKPCQRLSDLFPASEQIGRLGLATADDRRVWECAKGGDFTMVSQDADFAEMVTPYGPPPKVIWLRCGHQATSSIADVLRRRAEARRLVGTPIWPAWKSIELCKGIRRSMRRSLGLRRLTTARPPRRRERRGVQLAKIRRDHRPG